MRALRVDAIAGSGQAYAGRAFNDGLREAALHHVPIHVARSGDRWLTDDGVTLSVLSPCGALFADGKNDVNENSVVVMLACRGFRMLFMGDAGLAAEERLLASGSDLRAVCYTESGVRPNTLVLFAPLTQRFQTWAIPSGRGVVRNMMVTRDGNTGGSSRAPFFADCLSYRLLAGAGTVHNPSRTDSTPAVHIEIRRID